MFIKAYIFSFWKTRESCLKNIENEFLCLFLNFSHKKEHFFTQNINSISVCYIDVMYLIVLPCFKSFSYVKLQLFFSLIFACTYVWYESTNISWWHICSALFVSKYCLWTVGLCKQAPLKEKRNSVINWLLY